MALRAMGREHAEDAAAHVLLVGDLLKMGRVDACRVPTEMVEEHAVSDRSDDLFVGEPVCELVPAVGDPEHPVAVDVLRCRPEPA